MAKGALGQQTEEDVGLRLVAVRVILQPLISCVIAFDTDAGHVFLLPHPDQPETMARSERAIESFAELKLARIYVRVASSGREKFLS